MLFILRLVLINYFYDFYDLCQWQFWISTYVRWYTDDIAVGKSFCGRFSYCSHVTNCIVIILLFHVSSCIEHHIIQNNDHLYKRWFFPENNVSVLKWQIMFQHKFNFYSKVNNGLLVMSVILQNLTGAGVENVLSILFKYIILDTRLSIIYQNNGGPSDCRRTMREYLTETFCNHQTRWNVLSASLKCYKSVDLY